MFSLVVFSRQRLSRLTFLKVFCLQTPSSDLKMIGVFTSKIKFHLTVIWVDHARELINLNNMAGAGGPNEARLFVLLLLITVYMRLVFFRRRNRFQQRLRLLALSDRRRVMEAYFYHPRRKICRRRKVAWVLERPQFWFENMVWN